MTNNPLKMAPENKGDSAKGWVSSKGSFREIAKARFDRLWLNYPEQFDAARNSAGCERIERTLYLIQKFITPKDTLVADLGCGNGTLTRRVRDLGAHVDAVDIAAIALNDLKKHDMQNITAVADYVPRTTLKDDHYDIVLALEIIAYMPQEELRLFMVELSRIVKSDGFTVVSSSIDINSDDALKRFHELAETEFLIEEWAYAFHKYWIRLDDFFAAPERFTKAFSDQGYRQLKLTQRRGLSHFWFGINSKKPLGYLWIPINFISKPISRWVRHSRNLLNFLEKICRTLSPINGISHATWIGKRRPIIEQFPKVLPEERKGKKQVWE